MYSGYLLFNMIDPILKIPQPMPKSSIVLSLISSYMLCIVCSMHALSCCESTSCVCCKKHKKHAKWTQQLKDTIIHVELRVRNVRGCRVLFKLHFRLFEYLYLLQVLFQLSQLHRNEKNKFCVRVGSNHKTVPFLAG
jgi:hypothetical protein